MLNLTQDTFWSVDPNVLLKTGDFFPTPNMSLVQQLNAVSRVVIVMSLLLFSIYQKALYLCIGAITLGGIWIVYQYYICPMQIKEAFASYKSKLNKHMEEDHDVRTYDPTLFQKSTPENPFGNVLLTDITDNPNRLPAPPAYIPEVRDEIMNNVKLMIAKMHPENPGIVQKMFGDMNEQFALEQSCRQWVTNPVTTVAGDIRGVMNYIYGNTAACKDKLCRRQL
jgi:hypothetical protein